MRARKRQKGIDRMASSPEENIADFVEATLANAHIGMYVVQDRLFRVVNRYFAEYTG